MTLVASGPLFDGRAKMALDRLERELTEDVAKHTETLVDDFLASSLRNPTGYYQARIKAVRRSASLEQVSDSGVIYGPWLEGESSRNRAFRFKGYAHFRRASQQAQRDVDRVTKPTQMRRVRQMNQ